MKRRDKLEGSGIDYGIKTFKAHWVRNAPTV